jgi:hypothetical protein
MTGRTINEIGSDLSRLKILGVDRVILAVNAEKDYDVNKTIEFVKELKKFCSHFINIIFIYNKVFSRYFNFRHIRKHRK